MRYDAPMRQCDGDDGLCGAQTDDYYEQAASTVGGIPITAERPAPGWLSTRGGDYCPEHHPTPDTTGRDTKEKNA